MDYEKIHKILMEIVADQNNIVIESNVQKKENNKNEREKYWK